jgi:hypothetical protein
MVIAENLGEKLRKLIIRKTFCYLFSDHHQKVKAQVGLCRPVILATQKEEAGGL